MALAKGTLLHDLTIFFSADDGNEVFPVCLNGRISSLKSESEISDSVRARIRKWRVYCEKLARRPIKIDWSTLDYHISTI